MLIIIGILLITSIILLIIFRSKYSSSDLIQISIFVILTFPVIIFGIQTYIMNKNYELTQRAWLGPSEPVAVVRYGVGETSLKFDIWVKNFGKLPAKNVTIDRYLFIGNQKVWERLADEISLVFPTN